MCTGLPTLSPFPIDRYDQNWETSWCNDRRNCLWCFLTFWVFFLARFFYTSRFRCFYSVLLILDFKERKLWITWLLIITELFYFISDVRSKKCFWCFFEIYHQVGIFLHLVVGNPDCVCNTITNPVPLPVIIKLHCSVRCNLFSLSWSVDSRQTQLSSWR